VSGDGVTFVSAACTSSRATARRSAPVTVGGVKGGRPLTYGVRFSLRRFRGLLDDGVVGEIDVTGLVVALVMRHTTTTSPGRRGRRFHADKRGTQEQQNALVDVSPAA